MNGRRGIEFRTTIESATDAHPDGGETSGRAAPRLRATRAATPAGSGRSMAPIPPPDRAADNPGHGHGYRPASHEPS